MWFFATLSRFGATIAGVIGLPLLTAVADPDDGLAKKMLSIYVKEAEAYSLTVDIAPKKELELRKEPVFEWANPARNDQQGVLFLWLRGSAGGPGLHVLLPTRQIARSGGNPRILCPRPGETTGEAKCIQRVEAGGGADTLPGKKANRQQHRDGIRASQIMLSLSK